MGFKSVYQSLMDVFPQVDTRILRAVALEHSKDPDLAVEAVITEILPVLESKSIVSEPTTPQRPEEEAELQEQTDLLRRRPSGSGKNVGALSDASSSRAPSAVWDALKNDLSNWDHQVADLKIDNLREDFRIWDNRPAAPSLVNGVRSDNGSWPHHFTPAGVDTPDFTNWARPVAPPSLVNAARGDNGSWWGLNVAGPNVDDLRNDFINWDHHVAAKVDDLRNGGWGHQVGSSSSQNSENNIIPLSSPNPQQEVNQLQRSVDSEELILLHKVPDQGENTTPGSIQTTPVTGDDVISQGGKCNDGEVFFDFENEMPTPEKCEDVDGVVGSEHIPPVVSALEGDASTGGVLAEQEREERISHATLDILDVAVGENVGEKIAEVNPEFDAAVGENVGEKVAEVNPEFHVAVDFKGSAVEQEVAMGDFNYGISSSPNNVSIEVLEEIIEAGKDNKRTLFSAVESVMNKIREVELKEKEAEQAEEEAATAGVDIHVQVEELKKMLGHASEANNMHAGEVYGEKAILSTEVKELQARVTNLSEERDSALSVLDEMHGVLEERLVAAEELLRAAEKEKFDKEESARKALAEQQSMMEKVVHESKVLQEAAEENSKLREFLMDRGHVVDTLQGEISVICQDVRLLKEKIDNRIPLSQSISSSQTSCILASSGSSARTVSAVDVVPVFGDASIVSRHTSPASSVHAQSPRSVDAEASLSSTENDAFEERMIAAQRKEPLLEDEWDIVDDVNGDI